MKLISAHIKNIRLHKDVRIEFDEKLTLIGGPNEAGKSTLAEAIHKALFLKANSETDDHRALESNIYIGEIPEVELVFEVEGERYTMKKRFSIKGKKGSTILSSPAFSPLKDDEADSKMSQLLKTDSGVKQKAYQGQWSHLWVWQGQSASDPQNYARLHRSDLIKCMQREGAAVVMQTDLDLIIANAIQQKKLQFFTDTGRLRTSSELDLKEKLKIDKENSHKTAQKKFDDLINAASELDALIPELDEIEKKITKANEEISELEKNTQQIVQLNAQKEIQELKLKDANQKHLDLVKRENDINDDNKKIELLNTKINPLHDELENLKQKNNETKNDLTECDIELDKLQYTLIDKRKKITYYNYLNEIIQLRNSEKEMSNKMAIITQKQDELIKLKNDQSSVADIDQKKLNKIDKIQKQISETNAIIKNIATGVKLVKSTADIQINNAHLIVGEHVIITEDTTIKVGKTATIQICPGGGSPLEDKKRELISYQQDLSLLLSTLGVRDYGQALEFKLKREELKSRIEKIEQSLDDLEAEKVRNELAAKTEKLNQYKTLASNLRAELVISEEAQGALMGNIQYIINQLEAEIKSDENEAKELNKQKSVLRDAKDKMDIDIVDKQDDYDKKKQEVDDIRKRISYLVGELGDEKARGTKIREAKANFDDVQNALNDILLQLADLAPDAIEGAITRLNRVKQNLDQSREDKRARKIELEFNLKADGQADPREILFKAKNELAAAEEQYKIVERKANAINLLNDLFRSEQQQLSLTFTKPLADKIGAYLKFIYGTNVTVSITDNYGKFEGLTISRNGFLNGHALEYSVLSGGTKEQVAVAMRLAMAEVLATDHGGCLPIVLDDAFANTDSNRIKALQNMLDYAAYQRGLQVIVLSCNPQEYDSLGAKMEELRKVE